MQVPKLEKIVLSRGVGAAVSDKKLIDYAVDELTKITAKSDIYNFKERCCIFKLRKGCRLVRRLLYVGKECMSFR
jgi:large subunit ribosomal protein L5